MKRDKSGRFIKSKSKGGDNSSKKQIALKKIDRTLNVLDSSKGGENKKMNQQGIRMVYHMLKTARKLVNDI